MVLPCEEREGFEEGKEKKRLTMLLTFHVLANEDWSGVMMSDGFSDS